MKANKLWVIPACALAALLLASCQGMFSTAVEYRVTGTAATVSISYIDTEGATVSLSGVSLPWDTTFTFGTWGASRELDVQATNTAASGSITVSLYENGNLRKTETADWPTNSAEAGPDWIGVPF